MRFVKLVAASFAVIIFLIVISRFCSPSPPSRPPTPTEAQKKAKEDAMWYRAVFGARELRNAMRNPDSFKLTEVLFMENQSICYTYRAQNRFGGMSVGYAVLTAKGKFKSDESDGFHYLWNRECGGKRRYDRAGKVEIALSLLH